MTSASPNASISLFGAELPYADMFDSPAVKRLVERNMDCCPLIVAVDLGHLDPLVGEMSPDARVFVKRFMPGAVAGVFHANRALPPHFCVAPGKVAITVSDEPSAIEPIRRLGRPVLCMLTGELSSADGISMVDVSVRPARMLRRGCVPREAIERCIPMENGA